MRPAPERRRYEGWSFRDFAEGADALRVMEQADASPDVARLSDEHETRMSLALASTGSRTERLGRAYLRARGHEGGCLAIMGFEGEPDDVERRRVRSAALLRAGGGLALGSRPGAAWLRGRFAAPYLRDHLLDRGVMVETLETATTWSNLERLYAAVGGALRDSLSERGTPPLVMCHVSHLYRSGARSTSRSWPARRPPTRWSSGGRQRVRPATRSSPRAARSRTTTRWAATMRPGCRRRSAASGIEVLRSAKPALDPAGIMNPGKLLPA